MLATNGSYPVILTSEGKVALIVRKPTAAPATAPPPTPPRPSGAMPAPVKRNPGAGLYSKAEYKDERTHWVGPFATQAEAEKPFEPVLANGKVQGSTATAVITCVWEVPETYAGCQVMCYPNCYTPAVGDHPRGPGGDGRPPGPVERGWWAAAPATSQ